MLLEAEHRACAKHMYANSSKKLKGWELQLQFWKVVWSTFEEEFTNNMKKMGEISPNAARDLMAYPPNICCCVLEVNHGLLITILQRVLMHELMMLDIGPLGP